MGVVIMATKSVKVFATCLVALCCPFHHDTTATRASFLLCRNGTIWIPTRVKNSRHKLTLRCPPIQDYTLRVSLVIVLLLLLSGDVELNPGPTGNQVKCVCSVNKESGHMLQCEQCSQWCHSKCMNFSASLASTYPFVCPSCMKKAVTIQRSVKSINP